MKVEQAISKLSGILEKEGNVEIEVNYEIKRDITLKREDVVKMGFFELAKEQFPIKSKKQELNRLNELLDILKIAVRYKKYNKFDKFLNLIIKSIPLIFSIFYQSKEWISLNDFTEESLHYLRFHNKNDEERMGVILSIIFESITHSMLYSIEQNMPYKLLAYLIYYTKSDLETIKNQAFGGLNASNN